SVRCHPDEVVADLNGGAKMRVLSVLFALLFLTAAATAQAPSVPPAPIGNLAQVMRGILFPNANILFDVQSNDPGAPKKKEESAGGGGATSNFGNMYSGWQAVENSALALAEATNLLM